MLNLSFLFLVDMVLLGSPQVPIVEHPHSITPPPPSLQIQNVPSLNHCCCQKSLTEHGKRLHIHSQTECSGGVFIFFLILTLFHFSLVLHSPCPTFPFSGVYQSEKGQRLTDAPGDEVLRCSYDAGGAETPPLLWISLCSGC